jgi:hypothetical protein
MRSLEDSALREARTEARALDRVLAGRNGAAPR